LISKEGKALIGTQALGDTRADTKRRQAAVKANKTLQEVTKPTGGRKTALKRLGTMANTARVNISSILYLYFFILIYILKEGKAYVKRTAGNKKKGKTTSGRKRTGGRAKKATK
jgi:hypothetical protein